MGEVEEAQEVPGIALCTARLSDRLYSEFRYQAAQQLHFANAEAMIMMKEGPRVPCDDAHREEGGG
eukprot:102448-Pyramimonas_sp.AAC.1